MFGAEEFGSGGPIEMVDRFDMFWELFFYWYKWARGLAAPNLQPGRVGMVIPA
jgi:hypothetical protein